MKFQMNQPRRELIELTNATKSLEGSTKRGSIVQARAASPGSWWTFTIFLNGDVRCGSKPARRQCKVFFTKERMHLKFQMSQPIEPRTPLYTPDG